MSDHLNLTPVDIQRILSEADENTTGTIEFAGNNYHSEYTNSLYINLL